jgi:hypothetical protein
MDWGISGTPPQTNGGGALTNAQLRAAPVDVNVVNQIDLSAVVTLLTNILAETTAIDANTDGVETKLDTIISEIQANGALNHADLLNVITELQGIDANTDGLEASLLQIITNTTGNATAANQTTEITALNNLLAELQLKADLTETQPVEIKQNGLVVSGDNRFPITVGDFAYRIDGVIRSGSKGLGSYNFANGDLLPLQMNYVGTGSVLFVTNAAQISVTAGQYQIAQSKIRHQYVPGNPQLAEFTGDNLQPIVGTTIDFGIYTDSIVAPYNGAMDGFSYSTDDTTSYFNVKKNGVTKLSVPRANWDNPLPGYDFTNFTVFAVDYLYLGGAGARFFVKVGGKFVLAHTFNYAGTQQGTFILNPCLPIRLDVRSTVGARTTNFYCARVVTEGEINEGIGLSRSIFMTPTGFVAPTLGTSYAMLGIRLKSTNLSSIVKVINASPFVNSTNDQVRFNFVLNPTIAGVFTYSDVIDSPIQQAIGVATNTVTGGTYLPSIFSSGFVTANLEENNALLQLGSTINGTRDQIILVATLLSATVTLNGSINYKTF